MHFLIDGYNLLHASGIFGRRAGSRTLDNSRKALLAAVAASLPENELAQTVVVFDAAQAPPGLPRQMHFCGMLVRFAAGYADADELMEELIASAINPKHLTVVSSDHRLHRAARRRKATPIDSDLWFESILSQHRAAQVTEAQPAKPDGPLTEGEVAAWLKAFDMKGENLPDDGSPFPPGYGDDIEEA